MTDDHLPPMPPPRGKRRKLMAIRLTVTERRQVERSARLAGKKASEWVRELMAAAVREMKA